MTDDGGSPGDDSSRSVDDAPPSTNLDDAPTSTDLDADRPSDADSPDDGQPSDDRQPADDADSPDPESPDDHQPSGDGGRGGGPAPVRGGDAGRPETLREWVRWFRTVEEGPVMVAREVVSSVGFVVAIGLLLFAVSGVWPPMVAVQSGSMQPHMYRGDLVFIVEEHRFAGGAAVEGTGVVPAGTAGDDGYRKFGGPGDVIVYEPDGSTRHDPIIHRARFYVEEGENWYDEADPDHVTASNCEQLANCPAPNSGFITKGDNNQVYDQAQRMSRPVKPAWIKGKAMVRIPWLGMIRLEFGALSRGVAAAVGLAVVTGQLTRRRA